MEEESEEDDDEDDDEEDSEGDEDEESEDDEPPTTASNKAKVRDVCASGGKKHGLISTWGCVAAVLVPSRPTRALVPGRGAEGWVLIPE